MLLWWVRCLFMFLIIGAAAAMSIKSTEMLDAKKLAPWALNLMPILIFVGIVGIGVVAIYIDMQVRSRDIRTISAVAFGLLLGMLFGSVFSYAVLGVFIPQELDAKTREFVTQGLTIFFTLLFCFICVSTLLQTKDDFRFIIPYVEFSKQVRGGRPLVLDTSVIIDGRIADICETRIIDTRLIVPRFVLQELQTIADSADKLKRNRGRRGIDMLKRMQNNTKIELEINDSNLPELREVREVDQRLVALAKVLGARVVTNDYNLNKVAQLQGVDVINVNELANALKSVALPGEQLTLKLIKPGDQLGQGVGYLDDGTMVVAEQGRQYIGQEVNLTVTSVLQTPAGRMIFGRVESKPVAVPDRSREAIGAGSGAERG